MEILGVRIPMWLPMAVFFWLLFTIANAGFGVNITQPENMSTQIGQNLSFSFVVIGNETTYGCSAGFNYTALYIEYTDNNSIYNQSILVNSTVGNMTVNCTNATASNYSYLMLGFYKNGNYSYSYTPPEYTYESVLASVSGFVEDWGGYALCIFCYGVAYLITRRVDEAAFAGGVGAAALYFLTANPVFMAVALLSITIALLLKYAGG